MGAWAAPPNTAAMPTRAYAPDAAVTAGKSQWKNVPTALPSAAPMNKDGEKTPPEPPEPSVSEVATSLPATSTARNENGIGCCSTCSTVS